MMNEENINEEPIQLAHSDEGLTLDDFGPANFVKNPAVGETLTFKIFKVSNNPNTKQKNKETGKEFEVGLKQKDGTVKRIDIETDQGIYTISNWELFFKFFSSKNGVLNAYAKTHDRRFTGATISIKRLIHGGHANYNINDLAKIIGKPLDETKTYQEEVKKAIKEGRLFEVKLVE